ncbi:MAG: hypothetical protein AAB922_04375 [Patescibacteria group bacterium]
MTKYPKITIKVEDENGNEVYLHDCSFFDVAFRELIHGQDAWLKYLEETEDARKEEDLAQEPEVKGDK